MPRHCLVPDVEDASEQWVLEWSDSGLTLTTPDGHCVIETSIDLAHRLFGLLDLYEEEKLSFRLPQGAIRFQTRLDVLYDVKKLISNGLRHDHEYRRNLRRRSYGLILIGLIGSAIAALLFGAYLWWASWTPDPPEGHWLRTVGPFIRKGLFLLLGIAIGGPLLSLAGFSQLRRIQKIDRQIVLASKQRTI